MQTRRETLKQSVVVAGLLASTGLRPNYALEIAENGAAVPLGLATTLPDVKHMLILVEENPIALVAKFE